MPTVSLSGNTLIAQAAIAYAPLAISSLQAASRRQKPPRRRRLIC